MTITELKHKLPNMNDDSVYNLTRDLLYQDIKRQLKDKLMVEILNYECDQRSIDMFDNAYNDALLAYEYQKSTDKHAELKILRPKYMSAEMLQNYAEFNQMQLADKYFGDDERYRNIKNEIAVKKESLLIIEVDGESMKDAGFNSGDKLVIDTMQSVKHNNIIVANLNGRFFVKRYKIINSESWLFPENEDFKPYKISSNDKFEVIGVVKNVIKEVQ